MIEAKILNQIRAATCAIGYYLEKPENAKDPNRPSFNTIGTGFLVRNSLVITYHTVIEKLLDEQKKIGFDKEDRCVLFLHPNPKSGKLDTEFHKISSFTENKEGHIYFIEFEPSKNGNSRNPVTLGNATPFVVGQRIAVCGYPYGIDSPYHTETHGIFHFGPIIQEGVISAIAPYDTTPRIDDILLDVHAEDGMSGSPVFRLDNGNIIGILFLDGQATIVKPIKAKSFAQWLHHYETTDHNVSKNIV